MTTLSGALPELRAAYDALDQYARTQGITINVADFGGVRTLADTTRILKYRDDDFAAAVRSGAIRPDTTLSRFRPIAPFGKSYHNYGAAFDVIITARPSTMSVYKAQQILGAYAPRIGLRWGGTFSDPDTPHFELAIALREAQARYVKAGGTSVRDIGSSFDLTKFLPGLTPSAGEELYAPEPADVGFPVVGDVAASESGEAATIEGMPSDDSYDTMMVAGLVVAGVVAWAIHRKFFG